MSPLLFFILADDDRAVSIPAERIVSIAEAGEGAEVTYQVTRSLVTSMIVNQTYEEVTDYYTEVCSAIAGWS